MGIQRFRLRRFLCFFFLSGLLFCLGLGQFQDLALSTTPVETRYEQSSMSDADQFVQQGVDRYQTGDYKGALQLWQSALAFYQRIQNRENAAIVLENLARVYQQLGQMETAITAWEQATTLYRQLEKPAQVGQMLTEAAQAYSRIGQPNRAVEELCNPDRQGNCADGSALHLARIANDHSLEAAALGSLGDAYRLTGNYEQAIAVLQSSLALAQKLEQTPYRISALISLGNAYRSLAQVNQRRANAAEQRGDTTEAERLKSAARDYDLKALEFLEQSFAIAQTQHDRTNQLRSRLSAIPIYYRTGNREAATTALQQAKQLLQQLPDSRDRVYAAIDLAQFLQPINGSAVPSKTQCLTNEQSIQAETLLQQAIATAQQIQDQRAESFGLGELGHIYECRKNYVQALEMTQKARWASEQHLRSKDSQYLWEWQAGRILKAQGKIPAAIAAYEQAVSTLEMIRSDLLTANRDLQFDFRDQVEPVYRELVALRLDGAAVADVTVPQANSKLLPTAKRKSLHADITAALHTMDSLKLAELQNYFGNDCVLTTVKPTPADSKETNSTVAVLNSIILNDRTAIVLTLPNREKRVSWINIGNQQLRQEVNEFRRGLERFYDDYDPSQAKQLYNWIVRPFEADLAQAKISTLVFVQDGILRSIPMAALYDGEQFLIQRYAIATTPSLTLTNAQPLNHQNLRALALGLTQSATIDGQKFQALVNVMDEIQQVETQMPGSKPLLDREFTRDRLQTELSQQTYPIIHIATHGEFGTDPESTFLVTGNNQKLTLNELDTMIRSVTRLNEQIELLALTACQTAAGDDRAALGLAGVAIQAGAKSALASLWFVNDAATAKVAGGFYAGIRNAGLTKAEALRTAQIALIEAGGQFAHPAYWAPYVLVGSWL